MQCHTVLSYVCATKLPVRLQSPACWRSGELYHRFHADLPEFNFPDATRMTCFVDNVICATMRKTGVVVCSEALTKAIESRELLPSGGEFEVAFRAKGMCTFGWRCREYVS